MKNLKMRLKQSLVWPLQVSKEDIAQFQSYTIRNLDTRKKSSKNIDIVGHCSILSICEHCKHILQCQKLHVEDPVSVSREFTYKFNSFFNSFIMSGVVLGSLHHFYRKEYQAWWAPHYHILLSITHSFLNQTQYPFI
jgi:hypothetical protein